MTQLNEGLAKKQKITEKQRHNLELLYQDINDLFKKESLMSDFEYPKNKELVDEVQRLEFLLQKNWNFPQDRLCHTWWNRFSKCSCPVMDNNERFGQEKIINCSCILHSYICNKD